MVSDKLFDFTIVGAGLTGLSLAWDLMESFPSIKLQIIEKSKGCGGRLATRRIGDLRFDHGAQFVNRNETTDKWIEICKKANAVVPFPANNQNRFCGVSGMTQIAKILALRLPVLYNTKLQSIQCRDGVWVCKSDQAHEFLSKNIVITSPLPQSLEILKNSKINFDRGLSEIHYSCALVLLLQSEKDFDTGLVYEEKIGGGIFSICAQHLKEFSQSPSWTIVMDPQWSRDHFEIEDVQILQKACNLLLKRFPKLSVKDVQLKKWRYAQPDTIWHHTFESPAANLYLAGDSFGGASISGAFRSSMDLFEHLLKKLAP